MENRLVVFGNAPAELIEVADAHIERASDALIVSVAKKSGNSYIISGSLNMTEYAKGAIVKDTSIMEGQNTNAVFSINLPESELDEQSQSALNDYIDRISDLYEYMNAVDEGEIEDTRFNGQYKFDDFFRMSEDGLSILSVILRAGVGFGFPTFDFVGGWAAFEIEYRDDVKNPYHKVFGIELAEETGFAVSSNSGGTRMVRTGNAKGLAEKYANTKPSSSPSTGTEGKKEKATELTRKRRSLR